MKFYGNVFCLIVAKKRLDRYFITFPKIFDNFSNIFRMERTRRCSENKSMTQASPCEDEVRPGVANTSQKLSFTEVRVLVLIKQSGQIWLKSLQFYLAQSGNSIIATACLSCQTLGNYPDGLHHLEGHGGN